MSFGNRKRQRAVYVPPGSESEGSHASAVVGRGQGGDRRPSRGWFSGGGSGGGDGDKMAGQVLTIFSMIGVFALCAFGIPFLFSGGLNAGVSIERVSIPSGPIGLTQELVYKQLPAGRFERAEATEALMRACLPPLDTATQRRLGRDPGLAMRLAKLGGSSINGLGSYLICAMRTDRERLCNPLQRADLANELTAYFGMMARFQKDHDAVFGPGNRMSDMDKDMAVMIQKFAGNKKTKKRRRPALRRDVVNAMRYTVATNRLSASDFGWSVPGAVSPFLKDIQPLKAACQ